MSWTKPRSLCISWCHPCLNCTAATIHPSHTVSGTWNTACVVESKVSRSLPRFCLARFGAATKRSYSDRLQITWLRIILTCLLVSLGVGVFNLWKKQTNKKKARHSARCLMRELSFFFLKLTVQETVWLQRCYLWCSIAFCRNKNNWQIVHHSCWINHLSTSQNWLESVSCCVHITLMKTSGGGWETLSCADVALSVTRRDAGLRLYMGFMRNPVDSLT